MTPPTNAEPRHVGFTCEEIERETENWANIVEDLYRKITRLEKELAQARADNSKLMWEGIAAFMEVQP